MCGDVKMTHELRVFKQNRKRKEKTLEGTPDGLLASSFASSLLDKMSCLSFQMCLLFFDLKVLFLKRSEGGRRPTKRSVFKFFFESWLFFGQDFWVTMDKKMSRDGQNYPLTNQVTAKKPFSQSGGCPKYCLACSGQ